MRTTKILLGTRNPGKIEEAKSILQVNSPDLEILTREEVTFAEVEEDGCSYVENSLKKAKEISQETGFSVLSDDSGLEVLALDGAPGVHSSRFSGPDADDESNIRLLLKKLDGRDDRGARFVTVATLYTNSGKRFRTRGMLEGKITTTPRGDSGFGYDPVFVPDGFKKTLAQLGKEKKNEISHRRKALEKMRKIVVKVFN
ncbi:RdgB/HAM1 family non-canonical purine NTP pyrophosphatase [Candidatus Bipolaricaulota bacterium]|nr:RdgB/HAM1 family non-canonical purine NTP pyrophosphatase [Candidatus Bipolaricaulota bacterium]